MAEDAKDKNQSENSTAASNTPTEKKLFSSKNIIILAVMVTLLIIIAIVGITKISKNDTEPDKKKQKKTEFIKSMPGFIHTFETIVVNISGTHGTRYLKVTVAIEFEPGTEQEPVDIPAIQEELAARKMQLTDKLNTIFSSKIMDQIVNLSEREKIKIIIRDEFNTIIAKGKVKNVFFSDFVVQ